MLKHYLEHHKNENMEKMRFGMRTVRECRTAFDRQILESVEIQNNTGHELLNSKSEYNRCALPRLTAKLGELSIDDIEKKRKEEKEKEKNLLLEIKMLKSRQSKERRENPSQKQQPAKKKRKTGNEEHIRVLQAEHKGDKRKSEEEKLEQTRTKAQRKEPDQTEQEKDNMTDQDSPPKPPVMTGEGWEEDTEERWRKYLSERE